MPRSSCTRLLWSALLLAAALAVPAPAAARRQITIRIPRITLPPSSDVEICYFVRLPLTAPFMAGSWKITNRGRGGAGVRHFLAYLYTGERLDEFAADAKQVIQSRACLDLGPVDRDRRVLVATAPSRKVKRALPAGVALELAPVPGVPGGPPAGIGILLDANWANLDARPRKVSSRVVLRRVPPKRIRRVARPVSDRAADAGIFVPPSGERATVDLVDARWTAPGDSCVLGLSGQMHRRGRCVGADLLDVGGEPKEPTVSFPNPCDADRRQLYVGTDYTDPGSLAFTTPLAVGAGEALRYACWHANGTGTAPLRLGCEEAPGMPPGSVDGGPAHACSLAVPASSECPGAAACVPANLVAGPDTDDEICGLTALVYDAAPGGGCDVSNVE